LWDILGKPNDVISSIPMRAKCLLLVMGYFLRKGFSRKKLVGARYNSKKIQEMPEYVLASHEGPQ